MTFIEFLLALFELGDSGAVIAYVIIIAITGFVFSVICLPFRISKITKNVESINKLLSKSNKPRERN